MSKRKKITVGICSVVLLFSIVYFGNQAVDKNVQTTAADLPVKEIDAYYVVDVDNPREVVGASDYVFVGRVEECTGNTYEGERIKNEKGGFYSREAYTNYNVSVLSNIKNKLVMDTPVPIRKAGGISEDKTHYELYDNDELPEVGKTYIFMVDTEDDGTLVVCGANSNIPIKEGSSKLKDAAMIQKTEEYKLYKDAYKHQILSKYLEENTNSKYNDGN